MVVELLKGVFDFMDRSTFKSDKADITACIFESFNALFLILFGDLEDFL